MPFVFNVFTGNFDYYTTGGVGPTGPIGPTGVPGFSGVDGDDGLDSLVPGPQGIPGTGSTGPAGADGKMGPPGVDGEDGLDSLVPGPQGIPGVPGTQGLSGIHGIDGEDGLDSFVPGPSGQTGQTGSTGPQGIQGLSGIDGDDGSDSLVPGPQGIPGTGSTGPAGRPGIDGDSGDSGDNLSFLNGPTSPAGLNGQVQFNSSGMFGADSNLFWDNTNKWLGIGTSVPGLALRITGSGLTRSRITAFGPDVSTSVSRWQLYKSRGTAPATPGALISGDQIGAFDWIGDDGALGGTSSITFLGSAAENFTAGLRGANLDWFITKIGDPTATQVMRLADDGSFLINTTTKTTGERLIVNDAAIALHNTGVAQELRFYIPSGSGAFYSSFKTGIQAGTINYTLPTIVVASGVLQTTAGGVLSWAAAGGTGPQGVMGPPGADGIDGEDGISNIPGPQGQTGSTGPAGIAGRPGMDSDDSAGDSLSFLNGPTSPAGAIGEVQFNAGGMFGANSAFYWDITNKRLGIGTSIPMAATDIEIRQSSGSNIKPDLRVNCFSTNSASAPTFSLGRSQGSSPTSFGAIVIGDTIGVVNFVGDDNVSGVVTANAGVIIRAISEETWTGASHACRFELLTTNFASIVPDIVIKVNADASVDFTSDVWPRHVQYAWPAAAATGVLTSDAGGVLSWVPGSGTLGPPGIDGLDGEDSFIPGPRGANGAIGPIGPPGISADDISDVDQFALIGPPPPRPTLATRATITIVTETEQYATNIVDGAVNAGSTIDAWTVNELDNIYFEARANAGNFDLDMRALRPEFEGGLKGSFNIAYQVM